MTEFLINRLREIQKEKGFIPTEDLKKLSEDLKLPLSQVYGTATFYKKFYFKKMGKNIIELCCSPSCFIAGSLNLEEFLKKELGISFGETTKDKRFSLVKSSCIGCCDKSPAMLLNGKVYSNLNKEKLKEILKKCKA